MNVASWLHSFQRLGIELTSTDVVALEGAPIYLSDEPGLDHQHTNAVIASLISEISLRGSTVQLHALFDDMNCVEQPGLRERYREEFPISPHRLLLETDLIPAAWQVLDRIPSRWTDGVGGLRRLTRSGEDAHPALLKGEGVPTCALLDTAFQLGKEASLVIIVHPETQSISGSMVDFRQQQLGVHAVLRALRGAEQAHDQLPWRHGYVNIWLDATGNVINITRLSNKGRSVVLRGISVQKRATG